MFRETYTTIHPVFGALKNDVGPPLTQYNFLSNEIAERQLFKTSLTKTEVNPFRFQQTRPYRTCARAHVQDKKKEGGREDVTFYFFVQSLKMYRSVIVSNK